MSTNYFSTDLPEAHWWAQHQHMMEPSINISSRKQNTFISSPNNTTLWANSQVYHPVNATNTMFCSQSTAFSFNLNHEDDEELDEQLTDEREKEEQEGQYQEEEIPKEPLFEKPLTPSDVGKLNRLVIPKQHAEKYFPLSSNDSGEKGLLLSFEDESGKSWKFRYSYWNSSQSYVLTKGWSRFVKEKRLDAGDIVLFDRHRHDGDRFFIGWRRKGTPVTQVQDGGVDQPAMMAGSGGGGGGGGGSGGWTPMFYSGHPYPSHVSQLPYQPDYLHAGSVVQNQTAPSGHPKRLRLFGVNMECQPDESEPSTPDGSSMSSLQAPAHHHQQHQYHSKSHAYDHRSHMQEDINFSRDVNQMRFHQG